jgi:hypothetical protein
MSAGSVLVAVESVLLVAALVFLVAVLRSHAEILRRLVALESTGVASGPPPVTAESGAATAVPDLAGVSPLGDALKLSLGPGSPRTLLAFLSSGCSGCGPLWAGLRERAPVPDRARLVIVTHGPERESPGRLLELAPVGQEVVMSSEAFAALTVPVTPHFVLVDGGHVAGRGSAGSWEQIARLVDDADADVGALAAGARTTSERAARAEAALATAGIAPGHPSLYPTSGSQERGATR